MGIGMTPEYQKLRMTPLEECDFPIQKVSRGEFANEYGDKIEDYSKVKSPLTNRLISPYITSETHGENVFDWLVAYLKMSLPYASTVLDLGCGAGELMNKLKNNFTVYGTTIHLGEVKYGREIYGLADICPMDMRELDVYFKYESFDCIILHCSLHFIPYDERANLVDHIWNFLKDWGRLIIVDYKGNEGTGVDKISSLWKDITPSDYTTMGKLTVLQK